MIKHLGRLTASARSNLRGQAMIEFTLIMMIILLLTVGVMDLARGVYAYGVISNAARNGAHYGALDATDTAEISQKTLKNTPGLEEERITIGVQCDMNRDNPYIPIFEGDPNWDAYLVDHPDYLDWYNQQYCKPWNYMIVTVYYEFQPITLMFQPINMYSQSQMIIE